MTLEAVFDRSLGDGRYRESPPGTSKIKCISCYYDILYESNNDYARQYVEV